MKKQGTFLGIPYDWRRPTWKKYKQRLWNKSSQNIWAPKVFGWGYTINLYPLFHQKWRILVIFLIGLVLVGWYGIQQHEKLKKAHSTFENYYAFRGCIQLLQKGRTTLLVVRTQEKLLKL